MLVRSQRGGVDMGNSLCEMGIVYQKESASQRKKTRGRLGRVSVVITFAMGLWCRICTKYILDVYD